MCFCCCYCYEDCFCFCCKCPHGLHMGGYSAGLCRPGPPKQPSHHSSWLTGHPAVDRCHPCFYHDMTLFVSKPQGRCRQASPSSPKQNKHKSRTSFLRSVLARSSFETEEKLLAVKEFPPPVSVKQIREFVGLCNYFGFLIPKLANCLHLHCQLSSF